MEEKKVMIKLGVIGFSEGNGHPYSWSAIFNGYNSLHMSKSGFPVILDYLKDQNFPLDFIDNGVVTGIWTQDLELSKNIADASNIANVHESVDELIDSVDAVLLARDDAENHYQFIEKAVNKGKFIYIDKPIALSTLQLSAIFELEKFKNQIFSCSALQFAPELELSEKDRLLIGEIKEVNAYTPKSWEKYAVHIIEPTLKLFPDRGSLVKIEREHNKINSKVSVLWSSGLKTVFNSHNESKNPIQFVFLGSKGSKQLEFKDSFSAFKNALSVFVSIIKGEENPIPRSLLYDLVKILEINE
jgi:hypothetical protein